jgi:tetratricopeptide (TPR) repeat protein
VAKREVKKAVTDLEALSKANPGIGSVNFNLARAYLQDGNSEKAVEALQQGITGNPDHLDSSLLLGEILLRTGKPEAVVAGMVAFLRQYPTIVQAQNLLVSALRSLNRLDDAAGVVREQIRISPKNPQPHILLGSILQQQKKPAEAKQSLEKALELVPDYLPAVSALVEHDVIEKNVDAALQRVEEQKKKFPASAPLLVLEARVHVTQKQWNQAETVLQKALEIDPQHSPAYDLLLVTYIASKRMGSAIEQLERSLATNPDNIRALMLSAMIYGQMNEYEKAKGAYEKVLVKVPEATTALNNLAYLYGEHLNQLDRASELATKARTLDSNSPAIADTLGWILFKKKDYAGALPLLQESATKQPASPEIQFHLGMVSRMVGDNEAARAAFRAVLDSPNEFSGKEEARRELAALDQKPGVSLPSDKGKKKSN